MNFIVMLIYLDSCAAAAAANFCLLSALDRRASIVDVYPKSGSAVPNGGGLDVTTSPPGPLGVIYNNEICYEIFINIVL